MVYYHHSSLVLLLFGCLPVLVGANLITTTPTASTTTESYNNNTTPSSSQSRKTPEPTTPKVSEGSHNKRYPTACSHHLSTVPELCDATYPYRSPDGSCNNLNRPGWGQSKQLLRRLVQASYETGTADRPRSTSVAGDDLPSARKVSTTIHTLIPPTDLDLTSTHMQMLWGQYIDHDMSHTPATDRVQCCDERGNHPPDGVSQSENCIPITIPADDPSYNFTCMELVRSIGISAGHCGAMKREQINNITPWIDAGTVYGSSIEAVAQLRAFIGGRLRVGPNNTLPTRPHGSKCGIPKDESVQQCFLAGDGRVNVWSGLTGLHGTFVLEHNRIADILFPIVKSGNPSFSLVTADEVTFQKTRRIIGALHQVITYREYLPRTLGNQIMDSYDLNLGSPNYRDDLMPQIANEFATAAFRFGHNEIPFSTTPVSKSYTQTHLGSVIMEDMFFQPGMFLTAGHDNVMRGVISEPCKHADERFTKSIRDNLFIKSSKNRGGLDLPAINNQRGRDHGIPTYNRYREICNLSIAENFSELTDMTRELRDSFASIYDDVNDIDLFSGGLAESNLPGARVGPLFACLIADQFHRVKDGDRFWFENTVEYAMPFSANQIAQLSNYTLAKVICNNHDLDLVPRDVFSLKSERVRCDSLPDIDLQNWLP